MTRAYCSGEITKAYEIHKALFPFIQGLFCETNPCPLKAALEVAGLCESTVRLPLAAVTSKHYEEIKNLYTETIHKVSEVLA